MADQATDPPHVEQKRFAARRVARLTRQRAKPVSVGSPKTLQPEAQGQSRHLPHAPNSSCVRFAYQPRA